MAKREIEDAIELPDPDADQYRLAAIKAESVVITDEMRNKRAIGYTRTSTDEQSLGMQAQRMAIRKWAAEKGVELCGIFEEEISGSVRIERRIGAMDAIVAMSKFKAGVMIVAKRDRWARGALQALLLDQLVGETGGIVVSADGIGNGDGPNEQFQRLMMDGFSQLERAKIVQRIREAIAVKRIQGETLGHAPMGWKIEERGVGAQRKKFLVPDNRELEIIGKAVALRRQGLTLRQISVELADQGFLSRKGTPFVAKTILRWMPDEMRAKTIGGEGLEGGVNGIQERDSMDGRHRESPVQKQVNGKGRK